MKMRADILEFKDLSDSKEMMLSKPNPWMSRFIYLLIVILATALIWSYYGEMDEYIKANGVVRPMDKVSTVLNQVGGEIKEIHFYEGLQVHEGDLLYVISHDALLLEKNHYEKQIKDTELQINHLTLMRKSVDEMKNAFDKSIEEQKPWYHQYLKFETDYKIEEENIKLEMKNQEVNQKRLAEEKDNLAGYRLLRDSITLGISLFSDRNNSYALKFEDYVKNVGSLTNALNKTEEDLSKAEELYSQQAIPKKEVEDAKFQAENAAMKLETYKNQFMLNISENMENIQKSINDIESRLQQVSGTLRLMKIRNDKLVGLDQSIEVEEQRLAQLKTELDNISLKIKDCFVHAKTDGKFHILREFRKGDTLQSGVEVATILPDGSEALKVQLAISNRDISGVKTGGTVNFHFNALPYKEYGEMTGVVSMISTDAYVNQVDGISYYYVEATLDKKELIGYKDKKGIILVGMTCEAQVLNGSKKILHWLLEKIDLKD